MPSFTLAISAIGLGLSAAGVATQMYGVSQSAEASKKLAENQKQAEAVRHQQMTLEAMRKKREIIRQASIGQATAISAATNQGGAESSGLAGALSTVSGKAGGSLLATGQNEELGDRMFAVNSAGADLMGQRAQADGITSMGSGLGSLGGALVKNQEQLGKFATYAFS